MAHADDKIVSIRSRFGMWGIGTYWTLVERAAEQMDGDSPEPTASLLVSELCSFLGCKRNKLVSFLDHLQNIRGMKYKLENQNQDVLRIEIPKLAEFADNYTKFDGLSTKRLQRQKEMSTKHRIEKKKKRIEVDNIYNDDAAFSLLWTDYPNKDGKAEAFRHFKFSVKSETELQSIKVALANYLACDRVKKGYIKNGATWFNNWKDWIQPTDQMMKGNNGQSKRSSQIERAEFKHTEADAERFRNLKATLDERDRQRGERS